MLAGMLAGPGGDEPDLLLALRAHVKRSRREVDVLERSRSARRAAWPGRTRRPRRAGGSGRTGRPWRAGRAWRTRWARGARRTRSPHGAWTRVDQLRLGHAWSRARDAIADGC